MFSVFVQNGRGDTKEIQCLHNECGIGRSDENLVILQGWRIGKRHAWIRTLDDGLYLEPAEDRGGAPIKVNGQAVDALEGPLQSSDTIRINDYQLRVIVDRTQQTATAGRKASSSKPADRQAAGEPAESAPAPAKQTAAVPRELSKKERAVADELLEWRTKVHASVVRQMDLRRIDVHNLDDLELRTTTAKLIEDVLDKEFRKMPDGIDRKLLAKQVIDEAIGLGPMEDLIADDNVTEIMVNSHDQIYIEREGKIQECPVVFTDDRAVLSAIERIVTPLGRRIDESSPMVDARLKDGSRVNAVIPPIALRGPSISIRKFAKEKLTGQDLLVYGSIDERMLAFVEIAVRERKNIIVSGGTGSGKTTLLNVLSNFIPMNERVVTIEDAAELRLVQPNLVGLEARPPNVEGKGEVLIRDLVKNSLRMRPDRIIVGECRSAEALDMLQAMNTGHEGSLSTVHANSPRDALSRLEVMVLMAGMDLPTSVVREQIASALDLVVQQRRFPCGTRVVTQISEVTGMESGTIQLQDIYKFNVQTYRGDDGKVKGYFSPTGSIPEFIEELTARAVPIDIGMFRRDGDE